MTRSRNVRPQCLALLLCDSVIEDARTRNKSLISMFNGILAPRVPIRHERLCAFAAFSGGRGKVPISLRLCYDKAYEEDLIRLGGDVEFKRDDPNGVVDMVFEIRGFVFHHFGHYTFEVICDGVPLMMRRFSVSEASSAPSQDSQEGEGG